MHRIRMLLADDHPVVRDGIRERLEREEDQVVTDEAAGGDETVRQARRLRPDVVLLDVATGETDEPGRARSKEGSMATNDESTAIPGDVAAELCREIQADNRGRWYRWTTWWCWGCARFSASPDKMCWANHPANRGCSQVNARYEAHA